MPFGQPSDHQFFCKIFAMSQHGHRVHITVDGLHWATTHVAAETKAGAMLSLATRLRDKPVFIDDVLVTLTCPGCQDVLHVEARRIRSETIVLDDKVDWTCAKPL